MILAGFLMVGKTNVRGQNPTEPEKKEEPKEAKSQGPTNGAAAATDDPTYKIGAQDTLRIDVWREDQLTRTIPVRPDGKITLPLLNDVQAVGLTPMELAAVISEGLKKYITNPQVTVSVTEINSKRIYVNGEVNRSGAFQLLPHMTILQALSGSGGFTAFAKIRSIYILRVKSGKSVKIPFNYKEAIKGKNFEQNIELEPGDVIVVP